MERHTCIICKTGNNDEHTLQTDNINICHVCAMELGIPNNCNGCGLPYFYQLRDKQIFRYCNVCNKETIIKHIRR